VFVVEVLDSGASVVALGSGVVVQLPAASKGDSKSLDGLAEGTLQQANSTLIVTNTHVIDPGVSVRVRQGGNTWPAEIEHINLHADLCRLRVNGLKARPVELRSANTLAVGERVYSIGAPEGLELTLSDGLISGLRELDGERVIQTTAAISHGSSGGGLFDSQGMLVGITTFMFGGGQSLNFALPVDTISEPATPRDLLLSIEHSHGGLSYSDAVQTFGKAEVDHNLADVRLLEQALMKSPEDAHAHEILGDRILNLDPHRAIRELNEALRLDARDAKNIHFDLGVALRSVGDPYGAVRELRRSVELDPANAVAHSTLMTALMDDDAQPRLVLEEAEVVSRLSPKWAISFFPVAKWMVKNGDKDSGMQICGEMLKGVERKAFGHYCLGIVQWLGDPPNRDQSVAEFRQAALLGEDGIFHHTFAIVLELTGQYREALQEYKHASELDPNNSAMKADYESALKELQSQAPLDRNVPKRAESTERRRRLEGEIGCDAELLLNCSGRQN
jgi:tetratricopeptide (TPR) repeat protein